MKEVNSAIEPITEDSDPIWKTDPQDIKTRQRKQLIQKSCWTKPKVAIPGKEGQLGDMR